MLRLIIKYIPVAKGSFIICCCLGLIIQAIALVQPYFGGELIHRVQEGENFSFDIAAIAGLLLTSALISFIQQVLLGKVGESLVFELRQTLNDAFVSCPYEVFVSKKPSWFSERICKDADVIRIIPGQMLLLFQSGVILVGSLALMLLLSPSTLVVGMIFSICLFVFTFLHRAH